MEVTNYNNNFETSLNSSMVHHNHGHVHMPNGPSSILTVGSKRLSSNTPTRNDSQNSTYHNQQAGSASGHHGAT